jgi:hypothetical protein
VQLGHLTGASMQLLNISVPVSMWMYAGDAYGGMSYYDPAWDEEALASAQSYVDGVVARCARQTSPPRARHARSRRWRRRLSTPLSRPVQT